MVQIGLDNRKLGRINYGPVFGLKITSTDYFPILWSWFEKKKMLQANAAKVFLCLLFPKAKGHKNFRSKFALNAFVYIKKMNMLSFSLRTNMSHILYDFELEKDDKISHFSDSQTLFLFNLKENHTVEENKNFVVDVLEKLE